MKGINIDNELFKAEEAFNVGSHSETLEILNQILKVEPEYPEALMLRAKVYYRHQDWSAALNDLNQLLDKQPGNTIAQNYKSMVLDILSFWHKDNYNP